jgi:ABC-type molybdenum transport system ATPase subunit/photorepair protein PhrA
MGIALAIFVFTAFFHNKNTFGAGWALPRPFLYLLLSFTTIKNPVTSRRPCCQKITWLTLEDVELHRNGQCALHRVEWCVRCDILI